MLIPVILSGGSGTRLWPMSRNAMPKQFLNLVGNESMLQATARRTAGLKDAGVPIVVANEEHRFQIAEHLKGYYTNSKASAKDALYPTIILEPMARNTAAAIAAAAHAVKAQPEAVLLVMPSDHVMREPEKFAAAVQNCLAAAKNGAFITFGIVPTGPETGYGYIEKGQESAAAQGIFSVSSFKEKPSAEVAQQFLDTGNYLWNAGIFMFRADLFLEELKQLEPSVYEATIAATDAAKQDIDFFRIDREKFAQSKSISVDHAVMERTKRLLVYPLDCGWSDVGSWASLWEVKDKDEHGNILPANALTVDSSDNMIVSQRQVAAVGVSGLVVVDTPDALLVMHKDRSQDIKIIVDQLKQSKSSTLENHRKVGRPWGFYDSVDNGDRFQVKRITVKPGAALSLQMHHHRAEHWIVVSGTAKITNGEKVFTLNENESTYIPIGVVHRLENPGRIPLELIEVQCGGYLGEDDIVRFEDVYGRQPA
jgi:mannose-1-phosphate guanylyltransferase / mannose-6-phosphate isomerase